MYDFCVAVQMHTHIFLKLGNEIIITKYTILILVWVTWFGLHYIFLCPTNPKVRICLFHHRNSCPFFVFFQLSGLDETLAEWMEKTSIGITSHNSCHKPKSRSLRMSNRCNYCLFCKDWIVQSLERTVMVRLHISFLIFMYTPLFF